MQVLAGAELDKMRAEEQAQLMAELLESQQAALAEQQVSPKP